MILIDTLITVHYPIVELIVLCRERLQTLLVNRPGVHTAKMTTMLKTPKSHWESGKQSALVSISPGKLDRLYSNCFLMVVKSWICVFFSVDELILVILRQILVSEVSNPVHEKHFRMITYVSSGFGYNIATPEC